LSFISIFIFEIYLSLKDILFLLKIKPYENLKYNFTKYKFNTHNSSKYSLFSISPELPRLCNSSMKPILGGGKKRKNDKNLNDKHPPKKQKTSDQSTFTHSSNLNIINKFKGIINPNINICWLNATLQLMKILIPLEWLNRHLDDPKMKVIEALYHETQTPLNIIPHIKTFSPLLHNYIPNSQNDATELFDHLITDMNKFSAQAFNYYITQAETISCQSCDTTYTNHECELFFPIPTALKIHSIQKLIQTIEYQVNIRYLNHNRACYNPNCSNAIISVKYKYTHINKQFLFQITNESSIKHSQ